MDIVEYDIPVNVLIVDDKEENIYSLKNLLFQENQPVNFLLATSGEEALKIAFKTDLALILLDVQMPEMDGYEVVSVLKTRKSTQYVPVIFVTALNEESKHLAKGYSKGAIDFLFKPLDPLVTRAKVNSFINIYRQQKKLESAYKNLEQIVKDRTADLENKNKELNIEVQRREAIEAELKNNNEKLIKVNKDLDQFVYVASHDLKLPIANLQGLIQALAEEIKDNGVRDILSMIETSITQMRDTVNGLIEVIRKQQSDQERIEVIDCGEILNEVKLSISTLITDSGASIQSDFSRCDNFKFNRTCFKSILYNLITNSIKYRQPERKLLIDIYLSEDENKRELHVKDNGLGMSEEEQKKLFKLFSRVNENIATEGTGMGLYNLKNMLEKYGASIEVSSEKGKWTEFVIRFK